MATIDGGAPTTTDAKRVAGDDPLSSSSQTPLKKPKIVIAEDEDKPEMGHVVEDAKKPETGRVEEVDSDDEWGCPVVFTDEQLQRYHQQVKDSGGYEVDNIPGMLKMGMISPVPQYALEHKVYRRIAESAIEINRRDNEDGPIKFVSMGKINVQFGGYSHYFMTFKAEDAAGNIKVFRAKVVNNYLPELSLLEFRELKLDQKNEKDNAGITTNSNEDVMEVVVTDGESTDPADDSRADSLRDW